MLAQARPLWQALPDGALRRQLLPTLAKAAQLEPADLVSLWRDTAAATMGRATSAGRAGAAQPASGLQVPGRSKAGLAIAVPLRRAGRRAPAAPADVALRLLLRHSDWWERLDADDQQLLHGLVGSHGPVVAWLERQLDEHGAMTWAALEAAIAGQPWQDEAKGWVDAADPDEQQSFDDLRCVLHRLWRAHLSETVNQLIASGAVHREQLDAVAALNRRIRFHSEAERGLAVPPP